MLLLVLAFSGYRMYSLWQQESFWGYLSLIFFLAFWLITPLLHKGYTRLTGNWQLFGLSSLSGVLLALAFPPLPFTFLVFGAFIPLLIVEDRISSKVEGAAKWEVFKFAFHSFALYNILSAFWVANTIFFGAFISIFLNAAFMCVPFVLFHVTKQVMKKNLAYAAFIVYWITFEFLHMRWEISWSWMNLGNTFAQRPTWIQWYEYTGVFGGALWALLANVLLFQLISKLPAGVSFGESLKALFRQKENRWPLARLGLWILAPIVFSLVVYWNYEEQGVRVEAVAVNPNIDPHYEERTMSEAEQLRKFISLSQNVVTDSTDYLFFPETSFNGISVDQMMRSRTLRDLKAWVDGYEDLALITGIGAQRIYQPGEPLVRSTRKHIDRSGNVVYWEAYNAAIQMESGEAEMPVYYKSKLVPGAEFIPYYEVFFWLKSISAHFGGSIEGYGSQPDREVFYHDGVGVGPAICYESIYGEFTTGYVKNGANALCVITNDAWWDQTFGYQQHLLFARLRAIENRRSIARSANVGSCAFINQRGDILQPTAYNEAGAIKGELTLNNTFTIYTRYGDLIGRIALFTTLLLLLNTIAKSFVRRG
ncbi:MAG: apolipoprotein N-acyltransferase [Bacteroidota bacterium]